MRPVCGWSKCQFAYPSGLASRAVEYGQPQQFRERKHGHSSENVPRRCKCQQRMWKSLQVFRGRWCLSKVGEVGLDLPGLSALALTFPQGQGKLPIPQFWGFWSHPARFMKTEAVRWGSGSADFIDILP